MMEKEFRLCYVDGREAWFTDSFEKQWGDDWNDKPYETNAGEPYDEWYDGEARKPIVLKKVMFETGKWDTRYPHDVGSFSVEQINKRCCRLDYYW